MRRILLAALPLPLVLAAFVFAAMLGQAGSTRATMLTVAAKADVPAELLPVFKAEAQLYGVSWPYLAAYVRVELSGWNLPITSRRQRLTDNRNYNYNLRQNGCHPESFHPAPAPKKGEPDPCAGYSTPPDRPTDFVTLNLQWEADARAWLNGELYGLFDVPNEAGLLAIPAPRDLATRIALKTPPEKQGSITELADLYEGWYSSLEKEARMLEIVDNEDYSLRLSLLDWEYVFPVQGGGSFGDSWGGDRPQNQGYASTRHHGTDIMAPAGTPLLSVTDGTVDSAGWNYLGGWSCTIKDPQGVMYYYAHMQAPPSVSAGQHVQRGQVIGAVGATGEGPEGTSGHFEPHLHFGLYVDANRENTTNPYEYLIYWREHPPAPLQCPSGAC